MTQKTLRLRITATACANDHNQFPSPFQSIADVLSGIGVLKQVYGVRCMYSMR
jgi:hypothetical protein